MYLVVLPVYHCLQNSEGVLCLTLLMSVEDTLLRQPSDLMFPMYLLAEKFNVHVAMSIPFAAVQ